MKVWILRLWESLRSGFWFLPSLMAAGAVALAFGTVALDEAVTNKWLRSVGWVYTGGADGAGAVLQTIAGSMITIAGVVFSLTLVALSLASSQFGPRLLRNFMRDTATQLVWAHSSPPSCTVCSSCAPSAGPPTRPSSPTSRSPPAFSSRLPACGC